ncbi:hypothetical protein [Desulfofustis limnaeus]|nr:hypothetical protein [Desulfofustis limnaeus]MDX9896113.1 hypothetical protein [Desulfofustis sp.]
MKNGSEILAQPLDFEQPSARSNHLISTAAALLLGGLRKLKPTRRDLLATTAASLWIAALLLLASYLFLYQLAEHGW